MQRKNMKRYIEIKDDINEQTLLTTDDLPLELSNTANTDDDISLQIASIDTNDNLKKNIYGYLAQDEGYIFFQPVNEKADSQEIIIFHNDEVIEKSVWLKSGDIIQIGSKIISYRLTGDKVKIKVEDKTFNEQESIITPPVSPVPAAVSIAEKSLIEPVKATSNKDSNNTNNKKIIKILLIVFSFLLVLIACFILFAGSARITTDPLADKIELTGLFPIPEINNRYILINGEYNLKVYKEGYKTINKSLKISASNNEFSFKLKEKPGRIVFNIKPENNNKIFVDDVLIGNDPTTENTQYEIDSGDHNIIVINPRYKKFQQIIKIEGKNKLQNFYFQLEPNWGVVHISSATRNVSIKILSEINNELLDSKEVHINTDFELIAGQYTIKISKEKFKDKIQKINIEAAQSYNLSITELEPEDAKLTITSNPTGSLIRIDKQYMGKTPQLITIAPNIKHEIQLSLLGYQDVNKIIKLEAGELSEQNIDLQIIKGTVFISTIPERAQLFIDGIKQKKSSGRFDLSGHKHRISVKAKGYKTKTKEINASSYSKSINFKLIKIPVEIKSANRNYSKNKNKSSINNETYINSINQKMILIKPASFIMGSRKNEAGRASNEREHIVKLNYSYFLSEKEISNKQYRQFKTSHNSGMENGTSLNKDNQPVVNISWNEAAKYSNWLSRKEGLNTYYKEVNKQMVPVQSGKNNGYRLPFEAEWTLAAKAKKSKKYPWTGTFPPVDMSGNFADESARPYVSNVIDDYNDQSGVSSAIGRYSKNAFGFYDLGGNVSEWCQDFYSPDFDLQRKALKGKGLLTTINPTGPDKGTHKVVKDSSWRDASMTELRLSYRSYSKKKAKDIGFRIARNAQ